MLAATCSRPFSGRRGTHVPPQAVFLELAVKSAFADSQEFGGVFAVAGGQAEGFADRAFFELFEAGAGEAAVLGGVGLGQVKPLLVAALDVFGDVAGVEDERLAAGAFFGEAADDHVLDDVQELANVAGPGVAGEAHHRGVGDGGDDRVGGAASHFGGEAVDGEHDQGRDVFAAFAEGGI